jgi:hypothetical protein
MTPRRLMSACATAIDRASAVLWQLHGSVTEERGQSSDDRLPVQCAYSRTGSDAHLITVTIGGRVVFAEQFRNEADGLEEASYLLDHYASRGWTRLAFVDPRLH